ncbi:Sodium/hydrogen exchanger family-domain-containing protein [Blakeslea trispora]|nr:Sodium/hydrogen exchanger family-domain-containing protein [Blakeslea trispora]
MDTKAPPQAGIFSGLDPSEVNTANPITLFIIQTVIILVFCRVLAIPLAYIRQPRVIAEVIGGIILGPSVLGRIPNFRETIFPKASLPFLNLVATMGLVFFLFQVGLEVDLRIVKRDWKKSFSIALAGMALPFGLGCAVSVGLYRLQNDDTIPFSSFLLFLGVAMAITAFPVLARILAELKLLRTQVGAITMSAGLLNDCVAWVLLALVVALLNSSGGLEALYVFLATAGYSIFLIVVIAPLYRKLAVYTDSFERGPSPLLMFVTLLIVLISAFITDVFGVHAIFGGFLAGVIIPHDHGLAVKITEKIEDIVNIVFLPLYFTLSGLKTQIGLLDSGPVWGYVILVIVLACVGKIAGCAGAAKFSGMTTRESLTVGFLMSCKGLVELIVLNIGHDAGVLNDQVFVIMVAMALITTFMTTPVVMWLYPESYQRATAAKMDLDHQSFGKDISRATSHVELGQNFSLVTMINRIEGAISIMSLIRLLKQETPDPLAKSGRHQLNVHAIRLLELTQRTSDVMKLKDMEETSRQDPVLSVLRTFTNLSGGVELLGTHLDFQMRSKFVNTVANYSQSVSADIVLFPISNYSQHTIVEDQAFPLSEAAYQVMDADFVHQAFLRIPCVTGFFIDRGFGQIQNDIPRQPQSTPSRIVVPLLEGYLDGDGHAALIFALRLHFHSKTPVIVLKSHQNNTSKHYATSDSIQTALDQGFASPMIEEEGIDNLASIFVSSIPSNVILQYGPSHETHGLSLLNQLEKPLEEHDLVVVGRSMSRLNLPSYSVPSTPGSTYQHDFTSALGPQAQYLLKSNTMASLVVIQAPVLDACDV